MFWLQILLHTNIKHSKLKYVYLLLTPKTLKRSFISLTLEGTMKSYAIYAKFILFKWWYEAMYPEETNRFPDRLIEHMVLNE